MNRWSSHKWVLPLRSTKGKGKKEEQVQQSRQPGGAVRSQSPKNSPRGPSSPELVIGKQSREMPDMLLPTACKDNKRLFYNHAAEALPNTQLQVLGGMGLTHWSPWEEGTICEETTYLQWDVPLHLNTPPQTFKMGLCLESSSLLKICGDLRSALYSAPEPPSATWHRLMVLQVSGIGRVRQLLYCIKLGSVKLGSSLLEDSEI